MQKTLKSTTALILSLSLAVPSTGFAQSANADAQLDVLKLAQAATEAEAEVEAEMDVETDKSKKKKKKKNRKKDETAAAATEAEPEEASDVEQVADEAEEVAEEAASEDTATVEAEPEPENQPAQAAQAEPAPVEAEAETTAQSEDQPRAGQRAEGDTAESSTDENAKAAKKEARKAARKERRKERMEARQEDTEESTRRANRKQRVAAEREEGGERRTEQVTEENSRSSNEEFAAAPAGSDDGGLNNFEKFLIGAAGVGVLAAILNDNDEEVVQTSQDRIVVERGDGDYYVLKDDNALLRQPGSTVDTESFSDGSTRQTINLADGTRVVTIRAANGQVLSRRTFLPNGNEVTMFDDTQDVEPVDVSNLPSRQNQTVASEAMTQQELRAALESIRLEDVDRRFSLQQVREIRAVRELVPVIELSAVTFDTGSAVIRATQAEELAQIGEAMTDIIAERPGEVFLVEGHTDAVGSAASNLVLSDRRAESVALALTEYFNVPPQNLVVQGYGESNLRIPTEASERANRRAAVRRITPLLQTAQVN